MGIEKRTSFPRLESFHLSGKRNISDVVDLSDEDFSEEDNDIKIFNFFPKITCFGTRKRNNNSGKGEYSYSKGRPFICDLCLDKKTGRDAFYISGCHHFYCSDCVAKHILSELDDNNINIRCPAFGCRGTLEAEFCRSILPTEDFKRWNKAVCEVLFNIKEKFYCPFPDCSALLINNRTKAVKNLECPNCNRMICGLCKVRSHEGIECSEFKKLMRDDKGKDVVLANIADDTRWRQCPKCSIYVAKSGGCSIMECRSCCRFCYTCGSVYPTGMCNCYKRNSIFLRQIRSKGFMGRVFTSRIFPKKNPIHLD
ncbi:RBR-type E3 ubiquitin transferase [Trifolium repens]|nr:RBR-type E3 ubiquitin transferase [Trifolium repens]